MSSSGEKHTSTDWKLQNEVNRDGEKDEAPQMEMKNERKMLVEISSRRRADDKRLRTFLPFLNTFPFRIRIHRFAIIIIIFLLKKCIEPVKQICKYYERGIGIDECER